MLFFKDDVCIYIGTLNPISHSHHALEISIGVDAPLEVKINHKKVGTFTCCAIQSDVIHQIYIDPGKGEKITIIIDHDLPVSKKLNQILFSHGDHYATINQFLVQELIDKINELKQQNKITQSKPVYAVVNQFLNGIISKHTSQINEQDLCVDARVEQVMEFVKQNIHYQRFSFSEISRDVCLSESRLLHLFKQEVGIPFRKYVLWTRLKKAVIEIQNGQSITQAAFMAGFSDAPHFSNIYYKMFGLKPSLPMKPALFIK